MDKKVHVFTQRLNEKPIKLGTGEKPVDVLNEEFVQACDPLLKHMIPNYRIQSVILVIVPEE